MKTINGNNKLERLVNKAKKYINVELTHDSNKYMRASTDDDLVVVAANGTWKTVCTKYGGKYAVQPMNSQKTIWVASFGAIATEHGELIFKLYKPSQDVLDAIKGCDDIWYLNKMDRSIRVQKTWTNYYDFVTCEK